METRISAGRAIVEARGGDSDEEMHEVFVKDLGDFAIDFRSRTGTMSACKACNNEYARVQGDVREMLRQSWDLAKTPVPISAMLRNRRFRLHRQVRAQGSMQGLHCGRNEAQACRCAGCRNFDESWERFRETCKPLSEDVIAHWRAAFDRERMGQRAWY